MNNRSPHGPEEQDLKSFGFEPWQIVAIKRLTPAMQWEVYDEYIRLFMSNTDIEGFF